MADDRSTPLTRLRTLPIALAGLFVIVYVAVLVRTGWLGDDALISLRTVLNVTHGFGLTFNVAERVQTFTHPLWLLLVTCGYLLLRNIFLAAFLMSFAASAAAFWIIVTRARSWAQVCLVLIVLLFSRAFVDYSTSGLENPLAHLLIAVLVLVAVRGERDGARLTALWLVGSLLYLTRPDLVLFAVPFLVMSAVETRPWTRVLRSALVGLLPAALWTLFSLIYYGFPFPNTAYAKLGAGVSRSAAASQGILYLVDSLDKDPLTIVAIAFGILVAVTTRRPTARRLAAGILLYLVYVVSIGGDFMGGRFLSVPVAASALALGWLGERRPSFWWTVAAVFGLVGTASAHVPLYSNSHFDDPAIRPTGITDERGIFFKDWSIARATRQTFRSPGWPENLGPLPKPDVTRLCGLLGSAGLETGPYHYLLDECALADPLLSHMPAVFNDDWRIGHFRRMVPPGYEASVAAGDNQLTDPQLRAFYDAIRLITRSPNLWAADRLRVIWRMNIGRFDQMVNVRYYRHEGRLESLTAFSHLTPNGTALDDPANHQLDMPMAIMCDDIRGRRYIDVALDSNDEYKLSFLKGPAVVAAMQVGAVPEYRRHPGLAGHPLELPPAATQRGFDTIVVEYVSGDGHYGMGHLLVEGTPSTDALLYQRRREYNEPIAPR